MHKVRIRGKWCLLKCVIQKKMNISIRKLVLKYKNGTLNEDEARKLLHFAEASEINRKEFREALNTADPEAVCEEAGVFWEYFASNNKGKFALSGHKRRKWFVRALGATGIAALLAIAVITVREWPVSREGDTLRAELPDEAADSTSSYALPGAGAGAHNVSRMVLPDGTSVALATGTVLSLNRDFNSVSREVQLDGEAFFEVAKDSTRLFIVHCGKESYIVRGTSFNISSYSKDAMSVVTLHTGKLEARVKGDIINMKPGDELTVDNRTENYEKRHVNDIRQSVAWVESDALVFDETPLKVAAMKLARRYNVNITVQPAIENILYTGRRNNESLQEMFRLIELTSPVPIKISGSNGDYLIEKK